MNIYYDEEADYLEIMFGRSSYDYGDHFSEDIVLFRDKETEQVLGIGIFNFKRQTSNLDELNLELPVKVNLSSINV